MQTSRPRLLRIACRLRNAYASVRRNRPVVALPHQAWQDVQTAHRLWSTASDRDWQAAAERQHETLVRDLEHLAGQLRSRLAAATKDRSPKAPELRLLYEELLAAEAEFDGVQFEEGKISVATEPVVLDEIELGRFKICLHWDRLGTDTP